jgi:hypothetical protein
MTIGCLFRASIPVSVSLILTGSLSMAGCGSSTGGGSTDGPDAAAEAARAAKPSAVAAPFTPLDACALLAKADIEAVVGKKVMDGRKEEAGPLVTCAFGDPTAPTIDGRPVSQVVTLSVMTGQEGTYAGGAVAQAKDAHEMARKNAASAEPVPGLGEGAYWDKILRKLSFVKGKHLVDIDVESDGDPLAVAKAVATKALNKIPQ